MTQKLFYHSWWFWSFLILGAMTALYQVFIMRKLSFQRIYSISIHASFVFIICGAFVTHFFSKEAFLILRKSEQNNIMLNEHQVPIDKLPFSVKLGQFTIERYGGSGMPSNYTSDIVIIDGDIEQDFSISMNNIVRYGGYKLYQSSYDSDEQGSILMVNNDYWGSLISYIGYSLLIFGMALIPFNKQSRFKKLLKKTSLIIAFCSATLIAEAQVTKQNIKEISLIPVQAASGRIEPFSTFANNILKKLLLLSNKTLSSIQNHYWRYFPAVFLC